ncbi:PREDICTED: gamma-aminobutyric acid receptor subunit theta [Hipposideros armiger]|uniref:Gamma-aminobutyric acid receptor subunit theta n=1 Tax=Hipposideros armiger TaxID=186990 RepID=A0A8B7T702_HIPAR|nr:PREDICTED: gamma-aminobutyric acid receptor subunit theta [Hipposideros armiger]
MGIRGMLRAAVLLLLIRTWLSEGNHASPIPKFHFEVSSPVPEVVQNVFNCKNCANEAVVHKILDRVLSRYDARLRPNFGGAPVPVGVSMYISSIEKISETTMDYTITMFFHQTWKDPRLAYYETNLNLTLDYRMLDKLWVPDCYFLNSKDGFVHDVTVENRVFQLQPDGTVRYGIRLTTTAACSMNLDNFPMDKQTCKLEVESYGYTVDDIILYWEGNGSAIQGTEKLHIPQFSFLGKTLTSKQVPLYTGSYERLILKFLIQREIISYLVQVYWPTVLTTSISWISFWMNHESSVARVTVGLTSMLILNTINSHLQEKLPHLSCIKAIDIYMVVCFFFVFLSLLEYVCINYLFYNRRGSQRLYRQRRRARRIMARYRYRELAQQIDRVNIEHESGSPPSRPARARLASSESLSSLTSTPKQAPLATSESLSSLSTLSDQSCLPSEEGLNDLSSTSRNIAHNYDINFNDFDTDHSVIAAEIHHSAEDHDHAETRDPEDPEESDSVGDDYGHGPRERHLFVRGQRYMQEASCAPESLDEFFRVPKNKVQRNRPTLQEQVQRDDDNDTICSRADDEDTTCSCDGDNDTVCSNDGDSFVGFDQDKDSDSESDDSCPPSPQYSCGKRFTYKLFDPDYVPKMDKWSRVLFPLAFVVFNVVYWVYHTN